MWHASASIKGSPVLKPVREWRNMERKVAERAIRVALQGVGRLNPAHEVWAEEEFSIHLRRLVNDEELAFVGPAKDVRRTRPKNATSAAEAAPAPDD